MFTLRVAVDIDLSRSAILHRWVQPSHLHIPTASVVVGGAGSVPSGPARGRVAGSDEAAVDRDPSSPAAIDACR